MFIAAIAFTLLPFFVNPYALAAVAFLLGLGVGCAQPMTMSLLYVLTPAGRIAESFGLQKTVRNATHLVVPIVFGSVGAAFGVTTVLHFEYRYSGDERFPAAQSRHTGQRCSEAGCNEAASSCTERRKG